MMDLVGVEDKLGHARLAGLGAKRQSSVSAKGGDSITGKCSLSAVEGYRIKQASKLLQARK